MDRKIVITGASGGIGLAMVRQFIKEEDRIIACAYKNPERLSAFRGISVFAGDLSQRDNVTALFEKVREEFGAPDVLINNLGIAAVRLFQDGSDDDGFPLLDTDLTSLLRISREAVRLMVPRKKGQIINISSVWGIAGASCEAEYSAAKGGVNAFTKALAKELAPSHIRVNALALGAFDTEMNAQLSYEEKARLEEEIPAGRMGTPEEAALMVSLLLQAPEYLNGAVIKFDGAWI